MLGRPFVYAGEAGFLCRSRNFGIAVTIFAAAIPAFL